MRDRRILGAALVALVAVVVAVGVAAGGGRRHVARASRQATQVAAMFRGIPQHGQTLGDPHAPLTLFEFADLKCPICRAYTFNAFPMLLRRYVRTGKLRIVFQPQTFVGSPPGDSERAARFALAAGMQNRLWQFAELWYLNQRDENAAYATDGYVRAIAAQVEGLDVRRALAQRGSPSITRALQDAWGLFGSGRFPGTPGFALGRTGEALRPLAATTAPSQFIGPIERLLRARGT